MIRRPPRSTLSSSSAASDVYKRQFPHSGGTSRQTSQGASAPHAHARSEQIELMEALSCAPVRAPKRCVHACGCSQVNAVQSGSLQPSVSVYLASQLGACSPNYGRGFCSTHSCSTDTHNFMNMARHWSHTENTIQKDVNPPVDGPKASHFLKSSGFQEAAGDGRL